MLYNRLTIIFMREIKNIDRKLNKVGSILRKKRVEAGINSTEFSKLLGVSRPTLQRIEAGNRTATLYFYMFAFQLLKVDFDIVFKEISDEDKSNINSNDVKEI